tara:strand:- start:6483 stop:7415 length:933 start_codon:yes stop_codon:yes gene_type:complete
MKTVLISGCCGFIGQNLVDALIKDYNIIGIDNFFSSNKKILKRFTGIDRFKFIEQDISASLDIHEKIDFIINLACPASPPRYKANPIFTLETNFIGTLNLLNLAKKNNAIFIQASTSEIYGDPEVHPQIETYRGSVNTVGVRSCYDEGKRIAETLCYEYRNNYDVQTRILRIFNTYGPGMDIEDGRVISNFMVNTITNKPLNIYGDGSQTRSFCYIDDLVSGLIKSMNIDFSYPINLGNDNEISLKILSSKFVDKFHAKGIIYSELSEDDPKVRRPDITRAKTILNWKPKINLDDGLQKTYNYFKSKLNE